MGGIISIGLVCGISITPVRGAISLGQRRIFGGQGLRFSPLWLATGVAIRDEHRNIALDWPQRSLKALVLPSCSPID